MTDVCIFSQQIQTVVKFCWHLNGIFFRENFIKVYFSISGGSIETRVQKDFLHKVYANQWQTGEDSVFLRQHQDLKNSVKVDENGNVFLE